MDKELISKEFSVATGRARHMMTQKILDESEIDELSGIFQQATQGNCSDWKIIGSTATNLFDLKSKSKYNSWISNGGLSELEAKEKYCLRVAEMAEKHFVVFPEKRTPYGSMASLSTTYSYVD